MTTTPQLTDVLTGLSDSSTGTKQFLSGTRNLSYTELRDSVARTRGLFERLAIRAGDRIAIASVNEPAVSALYGACLLSGIVVVVFDPESSASEVNVLVTKSRVSAMFADGDVIDRASALQRDESIPVITVAEPGTTRAGFRFIVRKKMPTSEPTYPSMLENETTVHEKPDLSNNDPALILFTSGTTSQPKGVVLSRGNLAAQLVTFERHYGYSAKSRIANHLPLHHSDGLNQGPLLALSVGATWVRPAAVDMQTLGDMLDLMHRERATHLITVPTVIAMMTRLGATYDDAFDRDDFMFVSSTAGFLDETIWRSVEERFSTMVVNSYGLTETVMEALYCGPTEETRRPGTIGKPVDCRARLVDDEGHEVRAGEVGELWLSGENVMSGYFELPEETAQVMHNGWLKTGDLATCQDGFYTIAGRKKNVIIRGGVNVYPDDVNSVLLNIPGVTAAATIGVPDVFLGELVVSAVTLSGQDAGDQKSDLMAQCRAELAAEKVPNRIVVVDELPHGPSGKIEIPKVVHLVTDQLGASVEGANARDQVLGLAARIFGQPVETLSGASNAESTLGWDSLSFLELIIGLERQFDMSIAPRDVMTLKTLDDAVALAEAR